ncbi:proline-rich protein 18-like [Dunckerocampus dactyliophorus]|uniref:proline-rich protein 18-like n=1 Tax=Dunckerocampus dactyliophorus TaxID=161453 RepID=UPI00240601B5|nr:proline-rich protein 18-like [Dunckerocampus dactyliophorus]
MRLRAPSEPCMAQHAPKYLAFFTRSFPSLAAFYFLKFQRKTELLTYLVLCVSKMPFIPPVSLARSMSGLTGKDKAVDTADKTKTKTAKEDKGSSVKERLALNLKQLSKKSSPRSHLPTSRGLPGPQKKGPPESSPASSSGASLTKTQQRKHTNSIKSEPELRTRAKSHPDETRFTLTLTPEAVLLLQRRNSERRSAARNVANNAGVSVNVPDSRRRRDPLSRRHPASALRHSAPAGRAAVRTDVSAMVKVSLLNERHKYDDVEYEDEQDGGVDERVVLKCTEWLRGLENTPVSLALKKSASSMKSF